MKAFWAAVTAVLAFELVLLVHLNSGEPDVRIQNALSRWQKKMDSLFTEDFFKGD